MNACFTFLDCQTGAKRGGNWRTGELSPRHSESRSRLMTLSRSTVWTYAYSSDAARTGNRNFF
jgi:hypothetical protein